MSKRRAPRKPSGSCGYLTFGATGKPAYTPVDFPPNKADLEAMILHGAIATAGHEGINLYNLTCVPTQNEESDFDFSLSTVGGNANLDLVEFAPLVGRGGFDAAPVVCWCDERAQELINTVRAKAEHYGTQRTPLHLLVYITDSRFDVGPEIVDAVSLVLHRVTHPFSTIWFYAPAEANLGHLAAIYPRVAGTYDVDVEQLKWRMMIAHDLRSFTEGPPGTVRFSMVEAQVAGMNAAHLRRGLRVE